MFKLCLLKFSLYIIKHISLTQQFREYGADFLLPPLELTLSQSATPFSAHLTSPFTCFPSFSCRIMIFEMSHIVYTSS